MLPSRIFFWILISISFSVWNLSDHLMNRKKIHTDSSRVLESRLNVLPVLRTSRDATILVGKSNLSIFMMKIALILSNFERLHGDMGNHMIRTGYLEIVVVDELRRVLCQYNSYFFNWSFLFIDWSNEEWTIRKWFFIITLGGHKATWAGFKLNFCFNVLRT